MFETLNYGKSLDEELFESWLEQGRSSLLGCKYLLVIWDDWEETFRPSFAEGREAFSEYDHSTSGHDHLVAVYDIYSESRVF